MATLDQEDPTTFNIGNVYSTTASNNTKTYYVAISCATLVTYKNKTFGQYTVKKHNHAQEPISVRKLCDTWSITIKELDQYMSKHFCPDDEALDRARRDKYVREEEEQAALESNILD
jgi:ABC-type anion transport system duplicated permease subunit